MALKTRVAAVTSEIATLARLCRDLPPFLRRPISREAAAHWVRRAVETRPERFVDCVERLIYCQPHSPFLALLRAAGCELDDVRRLVHEEGVEGALCTLADRGVYVALDEFKGRQPAIRGSSRFDFRAEDFDNPTTPTHYVLTTGGSGGKPTRVKRSLPGAREGAYLNEVFMDAHGLAKVRQAYWMAGPVPQMITCGVLRTPIAGWLCPVDPMPTRMRLGARALWAIGKVSGVEFPSPEVLPQSNTGDMVGWIRRAASDGKPLIVNMPASAAVRVCIAASESGQHLDNVVFYCRSEPLTPAREQSIRSTGARIISNYAAVEAPWMGYLCATPHAPDDIHFNLACNAVIHRSETVAGTGVSVDALAVSTVSMSAPKVMLNVGLGDMAEIERRECGCSMGGLGLTTHISNIRSHEKLTGEGVTFARTNVAHIVEQILPSRHGGTAADFQLSEVETASGVAQMVLRIHPRVELKQETSVVETLLGELAKESLSAKNHAELLRRAATIRVLREPPLATSAGKVLPFHLMRRDQPDQRTAELSN